MTFERQLIGLAVAACFAGAVHANPTGPAVANGSASFATRGNALTVTNTPGTIINWQAFSIRPDEVTRFIQSGAASAVLNRVTGAGQSAILGQLLSNGRVFLINPNGVVVGAGARIDTAGFVASSLNLSNEDFLAGRFRFTDPGSAGKVTNAGTINAHSGGPVYLVAPTVENHGVITAPNGEILLAAGKSVELVSAASPDLRVQVQAGGDAVNVGRLIAESGRVGIYGAAIRNAGTVSADSASVNAAGNVVLKASRDVTLEATSVVSASGGQGGTVHVQAEQGTLLAEGRIEAKGAAEKGGDVKLLGTQVGLVGNAAVDATGATGGGTVNIGGSRQGAGPLPNSRALFIGADATVDASATANGNGGTVIAYADEAARIYGQLSARGGPQGGDGGFIETSGKQYLDVLRTPDATAPAGRGGEWLVDPNNILVVTAAGTCTNLSGCAAGPNWATTNDGAQLGVNLINTALNAGQSVTVTTTASGANTQPGNITFQAGANIAKTAGAADATVTLSAHNNIDTTGATISSANSAAVGRLNVALTADSDSSGAGNVVVGANVTTRGGSFAASGASISGAGQIITSGIAGRAGGAVTLTGQPTGTVNVTGAMTTNGGAAAAGSAGNAAGAVSLAGGTITVGAINALGSNGAAGGFAGGSGGTVTVTKTGAASAVTLNALIDVRGGNSTGSATGGTGGAVAINAGAGSVSSTANIATLINATGGTGQNGGTVAINAAGNIALTGAGNKAIVTSGGTASAGTAGRNAGNITIASTGGNVTARVLTANGSAGNGGNNVGGSGGTVSVSGVGATLNGAVSAIGGNSVGSGGGGSGGTVNVAGTTGTVSSVAAGTVNVSGGRGQNAGSVNVSSGATGTVNLAGTITANGGVAETASAGQNGGTVAVSGGTITVGAVTATGSAAAAGSNQAGGLGGNVTVTKLAGPGTVTLNGAVTTRGGNSNGIGNGGASGAVTVDGAGGNVTVGGAITTTGGRGQDAGAVSITSTGAVAVNNTITASGGTAATNAGGRSGGAVTITGGSVATRAITASGSNAVSANRGGGNAGTIDLASTAGGIAVNAGGALTARAGAATGTGAGGAAGHIALSATGGSIAANAITTQGNAKTDGGAATLAATGAVTAGAITTSGGTGVNSAGRTGGAVSATGADVTVGAVTTSGGAGAGANQAGGNAGSILLDATDGSPTITLNGNLAAAGGARTGTGIPGNGANITLDGNVVLPANRTITAAGAAGGGAGGTATFGGTVNSQGAARNLTVNAGSGPVAFGGAVGNTLALNALSVTGNGIALAATNAASMTLTSTGGNITQTGAAVITGATVVTGGAGAVTLTNPGNNFNTVTVASGASASIFDLNAVTAGPVTATGDVLIRTAPGAGNDITLAGNVTSTAGSVTLASGEDINYGANALSAAAGRWLTYSRNPASDTGTIPAPGGAKPNIYNCTFGGPCGATVPATGNHHVYSYQPLLTYTANVASRQYGDPNPAFSGAVSGLVNGDTAADAYSGVLAFTSPATGTSPVGGHAINGSGLTSDIGYGFVQAAGNATALTITPRPITLTAGSAARLYGDPNPVPAPLYAVGGNLMANGEDAQALFGFTVASGAIGTTPVGAYAAGANAYNIAGVGVGVSGNYNITAINPGTLAINAAPLTITANDASRPVQQPNPPFSATYTGFKNGETPAALGGTLALTTSATIASPPGPYAITPSGQTSTNYTLTYVDGVLTITPLPPVVPVPPTGGATQADNALITATQRSADAEAEVASRTPESAGEDCLAIERAGQRRVLSRCY